MIVSRRSHGLCRRGVVRRPLKTPPSVSTRLMIAIKVPYCGAVWSGLLLATTVILTATAPAATTSAAESNPPPRSADPVVLKQPILFVVRHQYRKDHHNTETMFQTGEINTGSFEGGGALKTIDLATGVVTTLIDLPEGVARDPDVSFDGEKILFSMRRNPADDYHLYEMNADGPACDN